MNTDPLNVLPSELGENLFLVFIVGPVMHGVVGLDRNQLSIAMKQVEKYIADNRQPGSEPQDVALTSMFQTLVSSPGNQGAMAHAAIVATWLVLNHPAPETHVTPETLKWVTFGAKEDAYVYDGGEDDAAFELSRVSIMADCVGIQPVRH
jgi:hypothetical protein